MKDSFFSLKARSCLLIASFVVSLAGCGTESYRADIHFDILEPYQSADKSTVTATVIAYELSDQCDASDVTTTIRVHLENGKIRDEEVLLGPVMKGESALKTIRLPSGGVNASQVEYLEPSFSSENCKKSI
ncbi:MAG: hypothetical protein HQM11_17330 [SAR324 cluster bacterium]|nr:hypothetical protein [SAR324 cluster bacterium]